MKVDVDVVVVVVVVAVVVVVVVVAVAAVAVVEGSSSDWFILFLLPFINLKKNPQKLNLPILHFLLKRSILQFQATTR